MSIFDPVYIDHQTDTKVSPLVLNRLDKDRFDELSSHSPDELWFIQDSELSGQPIVVDTRPVVLPTNLSELSNDVGYCTSAYVTSRGYATESWVNNKNYATQSYVQSYVADNTNKTLWRDWFQTDWSFTGLTFVAQEDNSTLSISAVGALAPSLSLEYTTDGDTWSDFTVGSTTITLANAGDKVGLRAKTTNSRFAHQTSPNNYYNAFSGTGKLAAMGNLMSVLDKDNYATMTTFSNVCFQNAFRGMTALYDAKDMILSPSTVPAQGYARLFQGCSNLVNGPRMQFSTVNVSYSCSYIFVDCSSLQTITMTNYTGAMTSSAWQQWVNGVPSGGTLYKNGDSSGIPSGWTMVSI